MKFVELKVHELQAFVNTDDFRQMPELPISTLRAHSQSLNPSADPNDTALIYALNEQNHVIGYIGILPAGAYSNEISKIYFISCWWAHPEAGRGVAMKLFFRMLELTQRRVFFFHLPEKMSGILKIMGGFSFPEVRSGFKGFLRVDFQSWISNRNPRLSFMKPLSVIADLILNLPVSLHLAFRKIQLDESTGFYAELVEYPGMAELKYISEIINGTTIFRSMKELNWVIANPWISNDSITYKKEAKRYRFSLLANKWQQHWIRVSNGEEIKGMIYLTIRDGVASLPYVWFKNEDNAELAKCIAVLLIELKVAAILSYNAYLSKGFKEIKSIFLHQRQLQKIIAWPREMDSLMGAKYLLQDGDGDAVFT